MWLAGGLVLLLIELATPSGFFVMFFGLGALTVGVLERLGAFEAAWFQWLVFTLTSVIYLLLFRGPLQKKFDTPGPQGTAVPWLVTPHVTDWRRRRSAANRREPLNFWRPIQERRANHEQQPPT